MSKVSVGTEILQFWNANWWWLIWVIPGMIGGAWEAFTNGVSGILEAWHNRRMEELKLRVELEKADKVAKEQPASRAVPGHCVHRNVKPVISAATEEVVAWLCVCGKQLDADWAILEEDL